MLYLGSSGASLSLSANQSLTTRLSEYFGGIVLTPNAVNTFALQFSSAFGTTVFGQLSLVVQPL
jgi:hypothetical protein